MNAAPLDATLAIATGTLPELPAAPAADGSLALAQPRSEIVFIESDVPDVATLARELGIGREVVILDAGADGLQQMAAALAGRSGIAALHVVTHGAPGAAALGTLTLDSAALASHQAELAALGRSLAPDADLLMYGCGIGAGAAGTGFVQQLALATGADVAASDDLTGSAALGGDWQLEITQGQVDTPSAATAALAAQYSQVLQTVTFDTYANFTNPGNGSNKDIDAVYRVNNDFSTQLVINGATQGVAAYGDGFGIVSLAPQDAGNGDTSVTLSFLGGQVFTATSLSIANWDNYHPDDIQSLLFKGYTASGQQIGSGSLTLDPYNFGYASLSATLTGMIDIAELKIFATTHAGKLVYLGLDSIDITNIHYIPKISYVDGGTADGSYGVGAQIDIKVVFDQAVTVTGTPQLQLETGTTDRSASYLSGSGTNTLTFRYTVQAGDSSGQLDYLSTSALTGTINAVSDGSAALLKLVTPGGAGSLRGNAAIAIDGVAPTLTISASDTTLVANQTATITFTFSEDPGSSFTNADVSVANGTLGTISASGAVRTATFTPTANVDSGAVSISVAAGAYTDAVGNDGGASNTLELTWDTLVPGAPSAPALDAGSDSGSSDTDGITNDTTPTFSGTAEAGSTVKLYDTDGTTLLGTTTATGGSWSITSSTLAAGSHTITAKATDSAGNVSSASAGTTVTIDTTPPSAPATPVLDSGSDTGSSSTDRLTSDTTPTISGTAAANSAITLYDSDGTTVLATTSADGSGNWSVATSTLADGAHTITAKATDAAGNTSAASSGLTVTVDHTAPAASSAPDLQAGSDSGSSATDDLTSAPAPVFSGTAEDGASVTLYDTDGTTILGTGTATGGTWTIAAGSLSEGTHTVTAKVTDAAGNESAASAGLSVTIDRTPPATAAASAAFSADSGTSATDFITNTASQTISGTLDANLAAGEAVEVSLDNGASWYTATAAVGQNTWSLAQTLTGSGTLQVRVVDAAGNTGTPWSHAYVLDTTAPTVAITSSAAQLHSGQTALITFTFSEDPGATFTADDIAVSGGTLGTLSGSGSVRTAVFTPTENAEGTASITLAAGPWTDVAGNAGPAGSTPTLTFDTLAPAAPGAPDLDAASDSGLATDDLTNDATPTFSGSAEAGSTVTLYDTDGTTVLGTGTATGGNWSITATHLADGAHTIRAAATDAAGNMSALSAGLDVVVDTTSPTVAITSSAAAVGAGQTATITFTFSEDPSSSFTLADVTVSGGTLGPLAGSGSTRTAVFTPTGGVASGTASITIAAGQYQDAAGNDGGAGTTPVVHIDTLPPAAPSVPDLDAGSDSGATDTDNITAVTTPVFSGTAEDGATVTLYDTDGTTVLGSTTASGGHWTITSAALGAGSHAITAQATDAAGNVGAASAALDVTIDTAAPTTTVASVALSADSGTSGTDFITKTASQTISGTLGANLAAGEAVEVSLDNGASWHTATAAVGQNTWSLAQTLTGSGTLQVRVADAAGNHGAALAQAYVLDMAAPSVTLASSLAQLKAGQTAVISFTFSEDPGATFTSADVTVTGGTLGALSGSGTVRTAVFTPADGVDAGTASITVAAGSYADVAGNSGGAGVTPVLTFDTQVPAAPTALVLDAASDSGALGDRLTSATTPTVSGSASAGATVTLYDSDGTTVLGTTSADGGGAWHITSSALSAGTHNLTAVATDAAGNASPSSAALALTIDNVAPAGPAALALATSSDSGTAGDRLTSITTPTVTGTAEALAHVTLYDSDGVTVLGTAQADGAGAWSITASALGEGVHTLTATQRDAADNLSAASASLDVTIDITPPGAPAAPVLAPASDTGTAGDRITWQSAPIITGTAAAHAAVTLYDSNGTTVLGTGQADGTGNWTIQSAALAEGVHNLTVRQADSAGNLSAPSAALALTIESEPVPLVDGVPVDTSPVVLPSGAIGIEITIPVVPPGRPDSVGAPGVADIPLTTGGDAGLLVAQVATGFGLTASTAPNQPAAGSASTLIAAIQAATAGHPAGDQQQLTGNGTDFLALLPDAQNLLVSTVKPVAASGTTGVLTLSGSNSATQSVALVIDTSGLPAGGRIDLERVDFAAIVGHAEVRALSGNTVLTGDGASQHFTVPAGGTGQVYAGGGADVLQFGLPPAAPAPGAALRDLPGTTLLHGGAGADTAVFNGTRASFNVEQHDGYLLVASVAAPTVKALVVNVEQLQFSDVTDTVPADPALLTLAGLYGSALGRQADLDGFAYWGNVLDAGASWGAVALSIIDSPERRAAHDGFTGSAQHDLELLYGALFNRHSDAEGLAFWSSVLARGVALEVVANEMMHSVEMIGHQQAASDWNFSV